MKKWVDSCNLTCDRHFEYWLCNNKQTCHLLCLRNMNSNKTQWTLAGKIREKGPEKIISPHTRSIRKTLSHENEKIINFIKSQRLWRAGLVQSAPHDRLVKAALERNPLGIRHLGIPRLRWRGNVIKDLETMSIDNRRYAMLDKNRWMQVVFAAKTQEGL